MTKAAKGEHPLRVWRGFRKNKPYPERPREVWTKYPEMGDDEYLSISEHESLLSIAKEEARREAYADAFEKLRKLGINRNSAVMRYLAEMAVQVEPAEKGGGGNEL
jgi:hypothetical protein